mmetsp:Transcript_9518/g.23899  ORF Transcript_9518/g.23899 Transcript_9518/m.23899 type:complete len:361 (-) Transcript_9518:691-1773(-)
MEFSFNSVSCDWLLVYLQLESVLICSLGLILLSISYNTVLTHGYTSLFTPASPSSPRSSRDSPTRSLQQTIITRKLANSNSQQLLAIDGLWYDITTFKENHPGGPVIERFAGTDATCEFYSMHVNPAAIRARLEPVGAVDWSEFPDAPRRHKINREYLEMHEKFTARGFFRPSRAMQLRYVGALLAFWAATAAACVAFPRNWVVNGIMIGVVFNTGGFLSHDAANNAHDPARRKWLNHALAWIYGNVTFGFNARWWREEHDLHHAIPNVVEGGGEACIDPARPKRCGSSRRSSFPCLSPVCTSTLSCSSTSTSFRFASSSDDTASWWTASETSVFFESGLAWPVILPGSPVSALSRRTPS